MFKKYPRIFLNLQSTVGLWRDEVRDLSAAVPGFFSVFFFDEEGGVCPNSEPQMDQKLSVRLRLFLFDLDVSSSSAGEKASTY